MAYETDIDDFTRGDSREIPFTVALPQTDPNVPAVPVDLTGARIVFTMKLEHEDGSDVAPDAPAVRKTSDDTSEILVADQTASPGMATVFLLQNDTRFLTSGVYLYDIRITKSGTKYTAIRGRITLSGEVGSPEDESFSMPSSGGSFSDDDSTLQSRDEKGVANGYAGLDADGKVPLDQLPITPDDDSALQLRSERGQIDGYASLDGAGKVPLAQLPAIGLDPLASSIASTLISPTAIFQVFTDPTGNDVTGDGSSGNPFRSLHRCMKPLEDASALNLRLRGQYSVHSAAGDYEGFVLGHLDGNPSINVFMFGDILSPPVHAWTLGTGAFVPNPARPSTNLADCYDYNVGAFAETIGAAQYWIRTGEGVFIDGFMVREDSASPNIRVESTFNLGGFPAELRTFNCRIIPNQNDVTSVDDADIILANQNPTNFVSGVRVWVEGFKIGSTLTPFQPALTTVNVSLQPCLIENIAWQTVPGQLENQVFYLDVDATSLTSFLGCGIVSFTALFRNTPTFTGCYETSLNGRLYQGGIFGGLTDGRPTIGCGVDLEWCSTRGTLFVPGGTVRLGDHGPFSAEGPNGLVVAHFGGRVDLVTQAGVDPGDHIRGVYGATHGPAVTLFDHGKLRSVPSDIDLPNLDASGQEVQVDNFITSFARVGSRGLASNLPIDLSAATADATPAIACTIPLPTNATSFFVKLEAHVLNPATGDEYTLSREIKARRSAVGVVSSTARTIEADWADGIAEGAVDVLTTDNAASVDVIITGIAATALQWAVRTDMVER